MSFHRLLKSLNVSGNLLDDFHGDVLSTVAKLTSLKEVDTRMNPFAASESRHWEHLVASCGGAVSVVDGKTVHEKSRSMIKNMLAGNNEKCRAELKRQDMDE